MDEDKIETREGDIFKEDVEAIVNTVNCEGVMGKGLALQFKKRFPENFKRYAQACEEREVQIGKMFVSKVNAQLSLDLLHSDAADTEPKRSSHLRWIINFPTKKGWRQSSRPEYIEKGLQDLVRVIQDNCIKSIAIPALGCDLGGLDWAEVEPMIRNAIDPINELRAVLLKPRTRGAAPDRAWRYAGLRQFDREPGANPRRESSMTSFSLSETDRMVQRTAHDFAAKEVRPLAMEYDERNEFAWDVAAKAAQIGLTGVPLGGRSAVPGITAMITAEELSWGCAGIALGTQVSGLAATAISVIGTQEQNERWLPQCTSDDGQLRLGALALTEPDAGSDAGMIKTRATRDGDEYVLNGTKRFITGGGIADITVVFARESDSEGWRDVSAFVVPKNADGFSQIKVWDKMGIRASHTADLAFDDVRIPLENRLGDPDPDFRSGGRGALGTLAATRPWIGAFAVGLARASFEYAADYARERKTMTRPLIEHQGVGFMLADMDIAIDAARLLTWRAGEMAASNQPFDLEEASKAKTFASDMAMKVATDAVQVCGGVGFMRELPLEKWMRDAKIFQIFEGANQIQRMVIARNIQNRYFA